MKKIIFTTLLLASNIAFASKTANQKIIGISMDYRTNQDGTYDITDKDPFYFVRENYVQNVQKACQKYNVTVVMLPINKDIVKTYSKLIDGLLIPGNWYDVNPKRYGEEKLFDSVNVLDYRNDFEFAMLDEMVKKKAPILGVCGGEQTLNVYFGGSLYQDLNKQSKDAMNHAFGKIPASNHAISIQQGTLLDKLADKDAKQKGFITNSVHHQSVKVLGKGLIASATTSDGIIEAIEKPDYPTFLLGTQWHPEFQETKGLDDKILDGFCKAVSKQK